MTEANVGEAAHGHASTLPTGDKNLFACCALITLGLSFFWSLVRNAGIASLVSLIGLDTQRDAAMLAYYVLLAMFAGAVAALYPLGAGAGLYAAARPLEYMAFADGASPAPQSKTDRCDFWSQGRVAALIGVLVLATLLKSLADSAFYDSGLRMVKHLVGILELSLILVAVNAMRGVSAPSAVAFYTLLGGLLLGTALACAPVPMEIIYVGVATITTARVLAEALALAYAAESIAWNAIAFFRAAFLLFVLPEMLACVKQEPVPQTRRSLAPRAG